MRFCDGHKEDLSWMSQKIEKLDNFVVQMNILHIPVVLELLW